MKFISAALTASALFIVPSFARATTCNSVAACALYVNASGVAVEGVSTNFNAIYGISPNSHGVDGRSGISYGTVGITYADGRFASTARAGVFGEDANANGGPLNAGVEGISSSGVGGLFASRSGIGVFGEGLQAGVVGYAIDNGAYAGNFASKSGIGVYAESDSGYALVANNAATLGDSILMESSSPMLLEGLAVQPGATQGTVAVSVDSSGNEYLAGTLTTSGTPQFRTRTATTDVRSYGARTSSPTLEDFGTAQLHGGTAYVALDHTFASAIDARSYMVFLTPHGDSGGLYVETASGGFDVRENKSGRSTLSFDYRIVAKPRDSALATRLPAMNAALTKSLARKPLVMQPDLIKVFAKPLHADGSEMKVRGVATSRL